MATFSSAHQPEAEVEDVIMKDASSIISADTPRAGGTNIIFDPMDISPAPSLLSQRTQNSQTLGVATNRDSIPQPTFSTLQPYQDKAHLVTNLDGKFGNTSLSPQTRSPFIKTQLRFSQKSRPPLPTFGAIHTRAAQLQPHQKLNPFATRVHSGFLASNNHMKPLPSTQTQDSTSAPSTRDSSFSSVDTQKSTEDGNVNSFDSSTSVSTANSFRSRKRSIDEGMSRSTIWDGNHLPYKFRRVSGEGFTLDASEPKELLDNGITNSSYDLCEHAEHRSIPTTSHIRNQSFLHPLDTQDSMLTDQVPGGWPPPSPHAQDEGDKGFLLYASSDSNLQTDYAMMSGALQPSQGSPEEERNSPDTLNHSHNRTSFAHADESSDTFWRTQWASWYDSVQKVYSMHSGVKQTLANAVRCAVAIADSCKQRALGLLGRAQPPTPRSSPTRRSPTRANIRALPDEQQRRVKEHQWRKDRGYPTVENYPFPNLSFDIPGVSRPDLAVQVQSNTDVEDNVQKMPIIPPARAHKHAHQLRASTRTISSTAKSKRRKDTRSGVRKPSRVEPVSPQLKRRMLMRARQRDPERSRRELALLQVIRHGKLGDPDESSEYYNVTGPPPTPPVAGRTKYPQDGTQAKLTPKQKHRVRFNEPLVTEPEHGIQPLVPELAPHLHPSPMLKRSDVVEELFVEQKENIPPMPDVAVASRIAAPEATIDPWLQPSEFLLGRPVSAVSLFYPVPKPLPPGRIESIFADKWREIEEEEKRKQRPLRIRPQGPAVRPLLKNWEARIYEAMSMPNSRKIATTLSGDPLTKKDLATCFTPLAWLNDEVINSYLALIIDYLRRAHGNAGRHDKPRFHAFNSFFFSNLRDKGYDSVRRWATRAKIGGESLLNVETVFVPVHNSAHWTLIVVKPGERTIEHFDSLGSLSHRHVGIVKSWLRGELGARYTEDEWTVLPSVSPQQDNGSDCGVFLLSTAKAVAVDIEPLSYGAKDTILLRKKIVAELMNGGLEGDFNPASENGEVLL